MYAVLSQDALLSNPQVNLLWRRTMSAVLSYVISLVAIEAFPEGKTVTNTDDQASDNYHKIVCYFAKGNPLEDFPLRFQV